MYSVAAAIAQKLLENRSVLRRGDDQNLLDSRQHKGGKRVIDHGLVVDGKQALGDRVSNGIEAGARPTRQDDSAVRRQPVLGSLSHSVCALAQAEYCLAIHWRY